jgi:hypothetical protein
MEENSPRGGLIRKRGERAVIASPRTPARDDNRPFRGRGAEWGDAGNVDGRSRGRVADDWGSGNVDVWRTGSAGSIAGAGVGTVGQGGKGCGRGEIGCWGAGCCSASRIEVTTPSCWRESGCWTVIPTGEPTFREKLGVFNSSAMEATAPMAAPTKR